MIQQGFRKGRGTTDGMFALRQLVEKRLEMQGRMAVGFVDLEKAFDTVPREMVMATVRWMGVPVFSCSSNLSSDQSSHILGKYLNIYKFQF